MTKMVAQQVIAPEACLGPESGMGKRIVLLGGAELKPDTPKAAPGAQFRPGNVGVVIPDSSAVPGWTIHDQDGEEEACQDQQVVFAGLIRVDRRF